MTQALILKVTLKNVKPAVWRELAVPAGTTYAQLHAILQIAFGWQNVHFHGFCPNWDQTIADENHLGSGSNFAGGADHRIDSWSAQVKFDLLQGQLRYIYDFGVCWTHLIKLERVANVADPWPRCLAGAGKSLVENGNSTPLKPFSLAAVNAQLAAWSNQSDEAHQADDGRIGPDYKAFLVILEEAYPLLSKAEYADLDYFTQSAEHDMIKFLPDPWIQVTVVRLMLADKQPLDQWTQADVRLALRHELRDQKPAKQQLIVSICVRFLQTMRRTGALKLTAKALRTIIEGVLSQPGLADGQDFDQKPAASARPHVMNVGSQKWHQNTATRVHKEAWRRLDAILAVDNFDGDQEAAGEMVADFADDMYAKVLQTPLHWEDIAVKEQLTEALTEKSSDQREDFEDMILAFLDALAEEPSMTQKRAKALQKLIHETIAELPKQSLGHKVSKKAGRKILKFQKR